MTGTMEKPGDMSIIEKRIETSASPSRVWRALTDHREFGTWFRVAIESPFEVGKEARGRILYPGFEHVIWRVVIREMREPDLFSFTWHPYAVDEKIDYSAETPTLVEFRLQPTQTGTKVTVTESGFENIPARRMPEAFRMNDGGWAEQVKNIKRHVES